MQPAALRQNADMGSLCSTEVEATGHGPEARSISIIIPTFNGARRIGKCLDSLRYQARQRNAEILVVDDGSTDNTAEVVRRYSGVRLIQQANAGPAAARNRGASEASGEVILFTDDDCVPAEDWLETMLKPFADPDVIGAKGVYRTKQKKLIARWVQLEYEDRYRHMRHFRDIDFVDTYSAAFRRQHFLTMSGYDTSFPVACAEDVELSYRMSSRGWKMKFVPDAVVFHTHPDTLSSYFRKKYKFAFWRVLAIRKNPGKGIRDSHTPQIMKLQLLFGPALLASLAIDFARHSPPLLSAVVVIAFLASALPFAMRVLRKDPIIGLLSPGLLAARACAQFFGVVAGSIYAARKPVPMTADSPAES